MIFCPASPIKGDANFITNRLLTYYKISFYRLSKSGNIEDVKTDVRPFLKNDPYELDVWSNDYFQQLADRIVFKE